MIYPNWLDFTDRSAVCLLRGKAWSFKCVYYDKNCVSVRDQTRLAASRANGEDLPQYANKVSLLCLFYMPSLSLNKQSTDPVILYNVLWLAMFAVIVQLFHSAARTSHVCQKRYFLRRKYLSLSTISSVNQCLFCGATSLQDTQIETASFCYQCTSMVTTLSGFITSGATAITAADSSSGAVKVKGKLAMKSWVKLTGIICKYTVRTAQ